MMSKFGIFMCGMELTVLCFLEANPAHHVCCCYQLIIIIIVTECRCLRVVL